MLDYIENSKENSTELTKNNHMICQLPTFKNIMQKETLKTRESANIEINSGAYSFQNS